MKTDIPQGMLGYFADLALKARDQPVAELAVTLPLTDPEDPDYDVVHAAVAEATAPTEP